MKFKLAYDMCVELEKTLKQAQNNYGKYYHMYAENMNEVKELYKSQKEKKDEITHKYGMKDEDGRLIRKEDGNVELTDQTKAEMEFKEFNLELEKRFNEIMDLEV